MLDETIVGMQITYPHGTYTIQGYEHPWRYDLYVSNSGDCVANIRVMTADAFDVSGIYSMYPIGKDEVRCSCCRSNATHSETMHASQIAQYRSSENE